MGSRLRDTVRYLFEVFCEVAPGDHIQEPYIIQKYPETYNNAEELKNVPKFTFPCYLEKSFVQHYSFVLTSVDSKYTFGFCRYDPKADTALVLLSHLPWHDQFSKLLNCVASLLQGSQRGELPSLLDACRTRPPLPGHTLTVTYNAGRCVFTCQRPDHRLPTIPENYNLTEYFSAMDSKCMAGLWAALLHERRIAIVASKPSRLSACVQAANATLFPMSWQHIFIPILPKHLVDYLLAPMPFLVGVPRTVMETVRMTEIGDVVVLDVDENELRSPFNDLESLPPDMVSSLKRALSDKNALGDAVSRAFLRALVCLIGGYRDAIRIERGQLITFNPDAFVRTRKNMQPFLRKILQSQIFQQFIDERLDLLNSGRGFNDEFEVECNLFAERLGSGSGQRLKQQYRDWAKTVKKEGGAFFKTFKDKANPAVQSAVKTVRQGGKNMKSAVRGLKNKIPKPGSRPSSVNTADDSRYSCGSATPVSSDSSESSPSHEAPRAPPLPLDLLNEMQHLFPRDPHDSLPDTPHSSALSLPANTTPMSPSPPRLPERPRLPARYPIVSTRQLVDISEAPAPPPRHSHSLANAVVSSITKDGSSAPDLHTSSITFTDTDKAKLTLTMSAPRWAGSAEPRLNGHAPAPPRAPPLTPRKALPKPLQELCGSERDLIKLDDSPSSVEDFDPLKSDKYQKGGQGKTSNDSELLHEYGLDFSRFGLFDPGPTAGEPPADRGWTTFN